METLTIKFAKEAVKMATGKLIQYMKDDAAHSYALNETFTAEIEGVGVGKICADYKTCDGTFEVVRIDVRRVVLICYPFPASARLWNGPDILPDDDYASMAASLVHDLIWGHDAELAHEWGVSPNRIKAWGNDILYAIWRAANGNKPNAIMRLAYHICDLAAPIYHKAKKILKVGATATACVALLSGCRTPPDNWSVRLDGTNAIWQAIQSISVAGKEKTDAPGGVDGSTNKSSKDEKESPDTETLSPEENDKHDLTSMTSVAQFVNKGGTSTISAQDRAGDSISFSALSWSYGGFKGGAASLVDGCAIDALKVSSSGMSYKWTAGGCESLGAASKTDAACLACLFVRGADGQWRGGKFDWISTSRTTRGFENIHGGYNGWDPQAIAKADAYAFVIVSKDGKRRTNVITCAN